MILFSTSALCIVCCLFSVEVPILFIWWLQVAPRNKPQTKGITCYIKSGIQNKNRKNLDLVFLKIQGLGAKKSHLFKFAT
jgi:hypothetical protein